MTQSARPKYEIRIVRLNEGYDLDAYLWRDRAQAQMARSRKDETESR